ncbi:MAG: DUF1080 domain-containing protein [Planctomycetes bacterium]|nr:DUF1080 domain-containing protein [Planctomycetota bacterium]
MRTLLLIILVTCSVSALALQEPAAGDPPGLTAKPDGFTDSPFLPSSKWRVSDRNRPNPPYVAPGGEQTVVPAPADAVVLFNGAHLDAWQSGNGKDAAWKLVDGAMEVNGKGDIQTRQAFGDCQLHIEWMAPVSGQRSQGAGNSGVFLMGKYEMQILDSWSSRTYADGQAAALYAQTPPMVNASRPPATWQSYDIVFRGPRFKGEELVSPATITAFHNGVLVHDNQNFFGATAYKKSIGFSAHPEKLPLRLQDHGNPVRFRNIWIREL